MDGWYYSQSGQSVGPVSLAELKGLLATGQLDANESVWHQSMSGWTEASKVPALRVAKSAPAPAQYAAAVAPEPEAAYAVQPEAAYQSQQQSPLGYQGSGGTGDITVTPRALSLLGQTRPWVMLMAVLFFIGAGLAALAGVSLLVLGGSFMGSSRSGGGIGESFLMVLSIIYFVIAFVQFLLGFHLTRYFTSIGLTQRTRRPESLEQAINSQLQYWRTTGIVIVAMLALYLIAIVIAVAMRRG